MQHLKRALSILACILAPLLVAVIFAQTVKNNPETGGLNFIFAMLIGIAATAINAVVGLIASITMKSSIKSNSIMPYLASSILFTIGTLFYIATR